MNVAIEALLDILHEILDTRRAGVSEHDVLRELAARNVDFFDEEVVSEILCAEVIG